MLVPQILAGVLAAFVLLRLSGFDGERVSSAALALTPYAVPAGLLIGGVLVGFGQPWFGGGALALTALLTALIVPRMIASRAPVPDGPRLRIMASNIYLGRGDVKSVIEYVREHNVDVLNLVELTPEAAEELDRAGLADLLPHQVFRPIQDGIGSGIAARHPLRELDLAGPSLLSQPSARIEIDTQAGAVPIEVVAVHPIPPTMNAKTWRAEIAGLPRPTGDGPVRVLAGDFNATLDHGTLRRLLRAGYRDAAAQCGAGLRSTWPSSIPASAIVIDHVLVDARAAVTAYQVLHVPDSDHRALLVDIALPG